jgi:hypothetical protein
MLAEKYIDQGKTIQIFREDESLGMLLKELMD